REALNGMAPMDFTLNDFAARVVQLFESGHPGMSLHEILPSGERVEVDAKQESRRVLGIIRSMTNDEREYPEQIHPNRARRIALGSGMDPQEVDEFVRQFLEMRKFMSQRQKTRAWGARKIRPLK